MIIIDIPQWMIYVTWFVVINLAIAIIPLQWLGILNKLDTRKANEQN